MMTLHYTSIFVIFSVIGSLGARQADIDINRLQRLPHETHHFLSSPYYTHGRRSTDNRQIQRSNDHDDYSGRTLQSHPSLHVIHAPPTADTKPSLKIHQPREDPKLFYISDAYLKKNDFKNVDHEVASIYPGWEVVRADESTNDGRILARKSRREQKRIIPGAAVDKCIRCPHDRTLITKVGSDRVVLQYPRLFTCSGHKTSSKVKFDHMFGPKFGSLLTQGSHMIVGRITYKDETLHLCKMQVHVIIQSCPVPKYLMAHCDQLDKTCNFTCKDSRLELHGESSSVCGNDMTWESELPVCRARSWCMAPLPPEHGRMSCKGTSMGEGTGLAEGSKCRIRCAQGWRPSPRGVTACRRGVWTHDIKCQFKNRSPAI